MMVSYLYHHSQPPHMSASTLGIDLLAQDHASFALRKNVC